MRAGSSPRGGGPAAAPRDDAMLATLPPLRNPPPATRRPPPPPVSRPLPQRPVRVAHPAAEAPARTRAAKGCALRAVRRPNAAPVPLAWPAQRPSPRGSTRGAGKPRSTAGSGRDARRDPPRRRRLGDPAVSRRGGGQLATARARRGGARGQPLVAAREEIDIHQRTRHQRKKTTGARRPFLPLPVPHALPTHTPYVPTRRCADGAPAAAASPPPNPLRIHTHARGATATPPPWPPPPAAPAGRPRP